MLTLGVPKEVKAFERRVGMTPAAMGELRRNAITVLIETGAGKESGFSDQDYERQGARIVPSAAVLYKEAVLIQKVKEPQPQETHFFEKKHVLFSYLHLAAPSNSEILKGLLQAKCTAIGFETVIKNGRVPLLAPMSRIAGALGAAYAAFFYSQKVMGPDTFKMPDGIMRHLQQIADAYPEVPGGLSMGSVMIWGGGVVGKTAADITVRLAKKLVILEKNPERIRELTKEYTAAKIPVEILGPDQLTPDMMAEADILMGCVHRAGHRADLVISREDLKKASETNKKILIDISIDQGGNFPDAKPTSYAEPVYRDEWGNARFAVPNIPSFAGRGASEALTKSALPYTLALSQDPEKALDKYPELRGAINLENGKICLPVIEEAYQR